MLRVASGAGWPADRPNSLLRIERGRLDEKRARRLQHPSRVTTDAAATSADRIRTSRMPIGKLGGG